MNEQVMCCDSISAQLDNNIRCLTNHLAPDMLSLPIFHPFPITYPASISSCCLGYQPKNPLSSLSECCCNISDPLFSLENGINTNIMQATSTITGAIQADTVANMQNTSALSHQLSECDWKKSFIKSSHTVSKCEFINNLRSKNREILESELSDIDPSVVYNYQNLLIDIIEELLEKVDYGR